MEPQKDAHGLCSESQPEPVVLIPVYNNRPTIGGLVRRVLDLGFSVVVVDDGSEDGTENELEGLDLKYIKINKNQGKGVAIKQGARWALEQGYSHIITMDGDGQHNPDDLEAFREVISSFPDDILLGKRLMDEAMAPVASRFGRQFSNFWVRIATGRSVGDSQSGFRSYPAQIFRRLNFSGRRYEFEVEALVRSLWAGLDARSIDVGVVYNEQTRAASHFRSFVDNGRISWMYMRLIVRRLLPWPHRRISSPSDGRVAGLSWRRPVQSMRYLIKESLTPFEVTLACMLGVFLGTLPLIGVHSLIIIYCATKLKLNRLIAFNISHLCAPPFVPALSFVLGHYVRTGQWFGLSVLEGFNLKVLYSQAPAFLMDYISGAFLLAPALALLTGSLVYSGIYLVRLAGRGGRSLAPTR